MLLLDRRSARAVRQGHRHLGHQPARSPGACAIVNFVWWIGIGHAGTLISAILLLLRQKWRTSINRFAEAMTLFAVACAGMFPILAPRAPLALLLAHAVSEHDGHLAAVPQPAHLGRLRGLDLRHRLAALLVRRPGPRPGDAARPLARARSPRSSTACCDGLARSAAPLARLRDGLSAARRAGHAAGRSRCTRSSASTSRSRIVPGWHTTIFPPYFVAGAVFSGFAMVLTLAIPLRKLLQAGRLHHHAPPGQHGEGDARDRAHRRLRLHHRDLHGLVQRQSSTRSSMIENRFTRPLLRCSTAMLMHLQRRHSAAALVQARARQRRRCCSSISMVVNVGMWLERFVIIVTSLHRDFLPSSWGMYHGTFWDMVDLPRHHRPVLLAAVSLHPLPAAPSRSPRCGRSSPKRKMEREESR